MRCASANGPTTECVQVRSRHVAASDAAHADNIVLNITMALNALQLHPTVDVVAELRDVDDEDMVELLRQRNDNINRFRRENPQFKMLSNQQIVLIFKTSFL